MFYNTKLHASFSLSMKIYIFNHGYCANVCIKIGKNNHKNR